MEHSPTTPTHHSRRINQDSEEIFCGKKLLGFDWINGLDHHQQHHHHQHYHSAYK